MTTRKVPKIPLSDRLRQADRDHGRAATPGLFRLSARDYCAGLDDILGGSSYRDTLRVLLDLCPNALRGEPMLIELVCSGGRASDLDRHQLLYQMLVRPYLELQKDNETTERSVNKCPFPPF